MKFFTFIKKPDKSKNFPVNQLPHERMKQNLSYIHYLGQFFQFSHYIYFQDFLAPTNLLYHVLQKTH